tara:strand:- start:121 stop:555 length:435 start_codon:yes stop_codon:yes gene_type:complete
MKQKEREIISHLRKDARSSLASISHEIKMPISTIYDKINKLHKNNVIKRYTTLVNFSDLGFHHHTKLILVIEKQQKQEFLNFLEDKKCINSILEVNSGQEFIIEVLHENIKQYIEFKEEMLECFDMSDFKEYQIINEIEREKFL